MKLYKRGTKAWNAIMRVLEGPMGYNIPNTNYWVWKERHADAFVLSNSARDNQSRTDYLRINCSGTQWCCGVSQIGNFYERGTTVTNSLPNEIKDEFFKVMISWANTFCNKGIIQAWFYKGRHQTTYQHPIILDIVKRHKFKKIGRATYNPNSGNTIQGYQLSISRSPRNGRA
jgi:hypothetical protein